MEYKLRHSLVGYILTGFVLPALALLIIANRDYYLSFLIVFGVLSLALTYAEVDFAKRLKVGSRVRYLVISALTGLGGACLALGFVALVQYTLINNVDSSLPWFRNAYSVLFSLFIALPVWSSICGLVYWAVAAKPSYGSSLTIELPSKKGKTPPTNLPQAANQ